MLGVLTSDQGGLATYDSVHVDAVLSATSQFSLNNKDPKAQMITTLEGGALGTTALVLFFYDGPDRPSAYDGFTGIPALVDATTSQRIPLLRRVLPLAARDQRQGHFRNPLNVRAHAEVSSGHQE